jgi:hypothetical protein
MLYSRSAVAVRGQVNKKYDGIAKPLPIDTPSKLFLLMFEILNGSLVSFRGLPRAKRAQVAPSAGFLIFLPRIQSILPGF